jgi:hypothetical protein
MPLECDPTYGLINSGSGDSDDDDAGEHRVFERRHTLAIITQVAQLALGENVSIKHLIKSPSFNKRPEEPN